MIDLIAKNFTLTGEDRNDHIYALLILLSVASIVFSWIYVFIVWIKNYIFGYFYSKKHLATYNKISQAKNARVLRKTLSNGAIDCILLDALESTPKRPVLINLSSKKVYIGIISGLSDPNKKEEPNKYISFFPVISSYRDKDTGLKRSNTLNLEWSQIDLQRKVAWIHPNEATGGKAIGVALNSTACKVLTGQTGKHHHWVFVHTKTWHRADGTPTEKAREMCVDHSMT